MARWKMFGALSGDICCTKLSSWTVALGSHSTEPLVAAVGGLLVRSNHTAAGFDRDFSLHEDDQVGQASRGVGFDVDPQDGLAALQSQLCLSQFGVPLQVIDFPGTLPPRVNRICRGVDRVAGRWLRERDVDLRERDRRCQLDC